MNATLTYSFERDGSASSLMHRTLGLVGTHITYLGHFSVFGDQLTFSEQSVTTGVDGARQEDQRQLTSDKLVYDYKVDGDTLTLTPKSPQAGTAMTFARVPAGQ